MEEGLDDGGSGLGGGGVSESLETEVSEYETTSEEDEEDSV